MPRPKSSYAIDLEKWLEANYDPNKRLPTLRVLRDKIGGGSFTMLARVRKDWLTKKGYITDGEPEDDSPSTPTPKPEAPKAKSANAVSVPIQPEPASVAPEAVDAVSVQTGAVDSLDESEEPKPILRQLLETYVDKLDEILEQEIADRVSRKLNYSGVDVEVLKAENIRLKGELNLAQERVNDLQAKNQSLKVSSCSLEDAQENAYLLNKLAQLATIRTSLIQAQAELEKERRLNVQLREEIARLSKI